MYKLVLTISLEVLAIWLLTYINMMQPRPSPPLVGSAIFGYVIGLPVYILTLVAPSAGYWVLQRVYSRHVSGRTNSAVATVSLLVSLVAMITGFRMESTDQRDVDPGLVSLKVTLYISGLVLASAVIMWFNKSRQYILHNRLLGTLAIGATFVFWGLVPLSVALPRRNLGHKMSIGLEVLFLCTLMIIFLSLINTHFKQFVRGSVAAASLWASGFLIPNLLLPFLIIAVLFWPLVILSSLSLEAMLFRPQALRMFGSHSPDPS